MNSAEKASSVSDKTEFRGKHDKKQSFILYTGKRKNKWRWYMYLTRYPKNMYSNATTNRNMRRNKSTILIGDCNISLSETDCSRD